MIDVKVVGLRRKIAEKMTVANARIPHITYIEEIDVTALEQLRATLNGRKRPDQPKLTLTLEREEGFVRIIARADNHLLLGIQGVGTGIAELSACFSLALEMGARLEDVAATIHAHPTQSEGFLEAGLAALGH